MDLIQSSEVSEVQQDLVRLNLKIRSKIETFLTVNSHESMEKLNGDIRGNFEEMRREISKLRQLAKKQEDSKSALMLKRDANNHEDQMTACLTAFKKANLSCIKRLESQGRDSLFGSTKNRKKLGKINSQKIVKVFIFVEKNIVIKSPNNLTKFFRRFFLRNKSVKNRERLFTLVINGPEFPSI